MYAALSEYASKAGLSGGTVTATWEAEGLPIDSGQGTQDLRKGGKWVIETSVDGAGGHAKVVGFLASVAAVV